MAQLTRYDIIKGPVISDKAYKLNRTREQLVLRVHRDANKPVIKDAIEKLFNVKVKEVRTLIRKKSKVRAASKRYSSTPHMSEDKVAYVTLAEGYSLNLFGQATNVPAQEGQQ
jgi:large subunit ribosomal protein L23